MVDEVDIDGLGSATPAGGGPPGGNGPVGGQELPRLPGLRGLTLDVNPEPTNAIFAGESDGMISM